MADEWIVYPPWTDEEGPTTIFLGSLIRDDFDVVNHDNKYEVMTGLEWTSLSRQEVANLRNLTGSKELKDFLRSHNCGISTGIEVDMGSDEDPGDAKFYLMISTKQEIPQTLLSEIVGFVKRYKVH